MPSSAEQVADGARRPGHLVAESTILDVARAAGVSVATVSRALRGMGNVRPSTRERVLRAAAALSYVANPDAAGLASGRSRLIGVVTPFAARWYFATIIGAIEKTLRAAGYHVMIRNLEVGGETRLTLTDTSMLKRSEGLVVMQLSLSPGELDLIHGLDMPVVEIGYGDGPWPLVGIDEPQATRLAAEHLIAAGHRRIGYLGAVGQHGAHSRTPQAREAGFLAAMADAGLTAGPGVLYPTGWTAREARDTMAAVFAERGQLPTALVCGSDEIAVGAHAAARRHGFRVPDDLALTGIDDQELAEVWDLTTVRQDVTGQGSAAATALLDLLADPATPAQQRTFPLELVVRSSTAGAAQAIA